MHIVVGLADASARSGIARELRALDYEVSEAADGLALVRLVFDLRPAAVVFDLALPPVAGEELLKMLHATSELPIVVLIGEPDANLTVRLLDLGAAGVAPGGTAPREIAARVGAVTRRRPEQTGGGGPGLTYFRTGNLEVDRRTRSVRKRGEYVSLTPTEYRLLDALASRAGLVAPKEFLLASVWGDAQGDQAHYLRVYIGYLRNKLEDQPGVPPMYITSEWGVGYRLALLPVEEAVATAEQPAAAGIAIHASGKATGGEGSSARRVQPGLAGGAARGDGVRRNRPLGAEAS